VGLVSDLDTVVDTLIAAVRAALAGTDAGEPARVCEVPGELAWDDCDCGVLAVSVDGPYLSTVLPTEAAGVDLASACPPPYEAVDMTVSVVRCAPGPDDRGNPPTCEALTAAAITWFDDLDAVRSALACALLELRDADTVVDFTLGETVPAGPEGGCVGSDTHLTVGFVNCLCPTG
jgi:hypothetical protein